MDIKGRLFDFKPDIEGKDNLLVLKVNDASAVMNNYDIYKDRDLRITIDDYSKGKSLKANGLFHKLVQKIADKQLESFTRVKNELVTMYGQVDYFDEDVIAVESFLSPEEMYEISTPHFLLDGIRVEDGEKIYRYIVFRGVRTYNTKEMAHLIECTIEYAKSLGVDCGSSAEMERILKEYEKHNPK